MAVGIITSPTTWLRGTVVTPEWAQTVQDSLNSRFGGGFFLKEDFLKATPDADLWTLSSTGGSSDPTVVADSTANGIGAIHPLTAGSGTSTITSFAMKVGTVDFELSARVRVALGGNYDLSTIISNNYVAFAGTNIVRFATGITNWMAVIGGTGHDTGVAWGSTYQQLTIWRTGGSVRFFIDGVQVYGEAHSADMGTPTIIAKCTNGLTHDGSMYCDTLGVSISRALF